MTRKQPAHVAVMQGRRHYMMTELCADVPALVHALGRETRTLVGHDWEPQLTEKEVQMLQLSWHAGAGTTNDRAFAQMCQAYTYLLHAGPPA